MKEICSIPIESSVVEQLQTLEALREEMFVACSIPYAFFYGVPSKVETATEVAMLVRSRYLELRNRLIDNAKLVNQ